MKLGTIVEVTKPDVKRKGDIGRVIETKMTQLGRLSYIKFTTGHAWYEDTWLREVEEEYGAL